jgi:flagellar motility protein MotE (MotC chaperone)
MIRLRRTVGIVVCVGLLTLLSPGSDSLRNRPLAQNLTLAESARSAERPATAPTVSSGNSLMEREAALSLKEQEMKKMEQSIDSRIKELEATRKGLETSLARKKAEDSEKYKKVLKVYKSLRPEEAAALLDKLDEDIALEMLNQMDQKRAAKLIPYLNQARVLKWTRQSLKDN